MAIRDASEVELKLELSPEAADTLETAGPFGGELAIAEQTSVYFDTPDHALSRRGLSLRIRRTGSRRVQTIKARGSAAGLFVRPEWEREVEEDTPLSDVGVPLPASIRQRIAEVGPVFTVENQRRSWTYRADGAAIEIALDRGRVVAEDREAPFREIELEQTSGDRAALFALARRIDAIVPVHLGVLSKAERGYRLLGAQPKATKARAIPLRQRITAAAAFEEIARACLKQFRINEPLIADLRDPDALHQARVALRRLRSALAVHKPVLADDHRDGLNDELRWLAAELGRARDIDVLIGHSGAGPLRERLSVARGHAYAAAEAALRSPRARGLMIDLVEWVAIGPWHVGSGGAGPAGLPAREFADQALDRARRKVRKRGRGLADLDDEARHELRKSAKKLRYAAEFYRGLYRGKRERKRYKRFLAALEALQDQLGALNDLVTAPRLLAELGLGGDRDAERLVGLDAKPDLLRAAAACHDALIGVKRFWR